MVFNSFQFLLIFLPACYFGFLLVHHFMGWRGVFPYLAAASLVFYAQFSVTLAVILAGSVVLNYVAGMAIIQVQENRRTAGLITASAVAANLFALGYFKYTNFLIDIANSVAGTGYSHLQIILPVGVSFFTFIQIGFLIEAFNGQVKKVGLGRYALFAAFFPCVTAGPLVLQREMFEQMEKKSGSAFSTAALSAGLTIFSIGLFKKVVLADTIAPYADTAFDGVAAGAAIDAVNAWIGSLSYSLQLYFDFSGYSDMAVGLGLIFGIKLPLNFNSPFKATSISDFWRRWHMTMTRFFTTYVYTPLAMKMTRRAAQAGMSRSQRFMLASAMPITYTFVIAGIWHGAGWTFVVYGLIHGVALAINHAWREFKLPDLGRHAGWLATMSVVVTGLVVFRAPDLQTAGVMLSAMWGVDLLTGAAASFGQLTHAMIWPAALIAALGTLVLNMPNSQEILRNQWVSCDPEPQETAKSGALRWVPNAAWAGATATVLLAGFATLGNNTSFLYYQF